MKPTQSLAAWPKTQADWVWLAIAPILGGTAVALTGVGGPLAGLATALFAVPAVLGLAPWRDTLTGHALRALGWTALALVASALLDGSAGAFAAWFALPALSAASAGRKAPVVGAAALGLGALLLVSLASGLGFAPSAAAAQPARSDALLGVVAVLAVGLYGALSLDAGARRIAARRREAMAGLRAQAQAAVRDRDAAMAASRAKSHFLAAMSHELRTPLNTVIGFSDLMKQRLFGPMPVKYAEYVDLIHESGRHLLDLIGDVLDMSKIEADRYELDRQDFDLGEVARVTVKLVAPLAEDAGLELAASIEDGGLNVHADRKACRQILFNLLSNAVKYTPPGGDVRLSVRAQGGYVVIAVEDTGVGMSADEIARLGQPFTRTDSARRLDQTGAGLGLSLVYALVELHGGQITVDSARGQGARVSVRLPILAPPKPAAAPVNGARERLARVEAAARRIVDAAQDGDAA
ncbi:MAG: sensor histidine kinase [Maricaulaceae bacterium]